MVRPLLMLGTFLLGEDQDSLFDAGIGGYGSCCRIWVSLCMALRCFLSSLVFFQVD